jgi:dGTPase
MPHCSLGSRGMDPDGYDEHARERWVADPPKAGSSVRGEFVRDRARVLHSAALRRLAAKTQVVGVGQSDFPRTRLTHSLECAQIGRELGSALGADPDLVDAACLAHDLGHPPFGHNGEAALDAFASGCGGFEGNAQSLRVLTRLETKVLTADGTSAGLNLTRAVLDAATKYPWPKREGNPKYGVYADDAEGFTWLRAGAADDRRCVEAQVMDWADDVAYSVHDLEDGVHAGHVPLSALSSAAERNEVVKLARSSYLDVPTDALEAAALRLVELPAWPSGFDGSLAALAALKRMTSELIARLSGAAVRASRDRHGPGPLCRYAGDVVVPVETRAECAILKAMADLFVMSRDEQRRDQAIQREQLAALAETILAGAPRTLEPWLRDAWVVADDDAARVRVVVDQVASLTDTSALIWHERLVS